MKSLDRYSLLCLSISAIMILTVFISPEEPEEDEVMIGIVFDVKQSQNGFTFTFEDIEGGTTRCFFRIEPAVFTVYEVTGAFSDDGSMLFVDSMKIVQQNEYISSEI